MEVKFVSYSHKDEEDKKEIKKFIGSIDTNFKFDIWDDTKIQTGDIWKQKIEKAISEAHIAILLLSIDFLDSDFIKNDELPLLLEKYNKDKIIIFCVLIGYCPIDYNPFFKKLQIFNKNSPLRDLPEGEKAKQLSKLAGEIYALCNKNHFALVMNEEEIMSSHLPTMSPPYFGKKNDLAEVRSLIVDNGEGIITLHGIGGIGKTRFAVEIALSLTDSFGGGCHFIELEKHDTLVGLILAMSEALNISATYQENGIEKINKLLQRRKPSLFVLDNFEQLALIPDLAKNTIEYWRKYCPHIIFLITSRFSLQIEEELLYPVTPLSKQPLKISSISTIKESESYKLFNYYANREKEAHSFKDNDVTKIAEIINLLEGHPKAIMLVAKRIGKLGLEEVLSGLKKEILIGKEGDYFKKAIDFSFGLLNENEKIVFTSSCIFQDGFDLEAAEQIIPIKRKNSIIHYIYQLCEHSLLNIFEIRGRKRFSMYRPLKEYGQIFLAEKANDATRFPSYLGLKYVQYYLNYAEKWNSKIYTTSVKIALDQLEMERENILHAHLWSLNANETILAARLIIAYADALFMRGPWGLRETRIQRTLDQIREINGFESYEIHLYLMLSKSYWGNGDYKSALNSAQLAVNLSTSYNKDKWLLGLSLFSKAFYLQLMGRYDRSSSIFIKSKSIFISLNDERNASLCTAHIGYLHKTLGNYNAALSYLNESEKKLTILGDLVNKLNCINWKGLTLWHMGLNAKAAKNFEEAIIISRDLNNMVRLGGCLTNLGLVYLDMENYNEAIVKFEEADNIHEIDGQKAYQAVNLSGWGYALSFLGKLELAFEKVNRAIKYSKEANSQSDIAQHYTNLGNMYYNEQDYYNAKLTIHKAIAIQRKINENSTRRYLFNLIYMIDSLNKLKCNEEETVFYLKEVRLLTNKFNINGFDPSPKMQRAISILSKYNN